MLDFSFCLSNEYQTKRGSFHGQKTSQEGNRLPHRQNRSCHLACRRAHYSGSVRDRPVVLDVKYTPLVHSVVSNEYEIATQLLQSMLQNGLINRQEYERIDAANTKNNLHGYTKA